ncbi:sodium-dependent phosphate transport protein 2b [Plakobranchus ocellatus]|uniref:Sodium-dependent phosphate transport protein 2b n=1 Tax=Plakobranchus ocellatus TaxID=259542 RepID=A0AAV3ZE85_9GAST|nr:sodium-dependent phosphate transport protein 2b [Plakobranchus ocellatus]
MKRVTRVKQEIALSTDLNLLHKILRVFGVLARLAMLVAVLYCFICALGLLEDAFKLLGGRAAGEAFRNSELLSNPIAGLMIGVMATVLVQSSSTATSIVVAMVASQVLPLRNTIPIVMGTNVGTSITSTLVSLAQAGDREQFRRAFSGATVHDMFNWCAVLVLLPLEVATGYLYHMTGAMVRSLQLQGEDIKIELLSAITKPFTELIVQINRDVITDIAMAPNVTHDSSVLLRCCTHPGKADLTGSRHNSEKLYVGWNETEVVNKTLERHRCDNLFAQTDIDDRTAGIILLIVAIAIILASLFGVVKILNSMLKGPVAKVIQKTVNADLPGRLAYFTGYLAILVGCGLTIVIQSSSVFTSTLTPLVGVGVVSVERMYPMTLGSNLGTTVTGMLAALSTRGGHLDQAMQIALVHLFFNISGVMLFFPVPVTRFPINLAKILGRVTARYRWFAGVYLLGMFLLLPGLVFGLSMAGWPWLLGIGGPLLLLFLTVTAINVLQSLCVPCFRYRWFAGVYLLGMFLLLPGLVFGLSMAGWPWLLGIGGPLLLLFLTVTAINVLQVKRPHWLPKQLRSWDFLPHWLHSLKPYDYVLSCACVRRHCHIKSHEEEEEEEGESFGDNQNNKVNEHSHGEVKLLNSTKIDVESV